MQPLETREIGCSGLRLPPIGLGCWGMSFAYGAVDERQCLATIQRALDLGITLLDTADEYGPQTNERLIGRAIRGRRDEVILATKVGMVYDHMGRAGRGDRPVNGRPEYITRACDRSLRRLGVDDVDLYYLHRVDPDVPIEESIGAMADLVAAGKIRHIGISEAAPETIRRAHGQYPLAAVQSEYSLWTRDVEAEVLPTARELGVVFIPYSPLGRGFLSGTITSRDDLAANDWRRTNPRFNTDNLQRNQQLLVEVRAMAAAYDATPAQITLAWLLHQGQDIVPIPGTTRPQRVVENAAATLVHLATDDIERLSDIFAPDEVAGARYTEDTMRLTHR